MATAGLSHWLRWSESLHDGEGAQHSLGLGDPLAAMVVATISAIYVTSGGQTSVIMTDLFQV